MPLLGTASGSEAQQLPTHFWKAIKKGIKIVLTVTKEKFSFSFVSMEFISFLFCSVLPISSGIVMLLMKALNDFMTLFFVSPMSEIGKLSVSIVVSTIDTISCVQAYDPKELLPSLGNLFGFIWNVLEKCVPVFASEKGLDEEMEKRISKVISSVLTYFLRTLSSTSVFIHFFRVVVLCEYNSFFIDSTNMFSVICVNVSFKNSFLFID